MASPAPDRLKAGCEALARADRALARAYEEHGLPVWRDAPAVYETIARTIAYQQISTKAAAAIWGRVVDDFGEITHQAMLESEEDRLRAHGLSRPKIRHLKSIAAAISDGALDLDRVCSAPPEAARDELLAVKGIGPWTADLFRLYAIGETDAFPTADVGLMESYRMLSDAETRLDAKAFTAQAEGWRPWRGVAAHLLWGWLNDRRMEQNNASP